MRGCAGAADREAIPNIDLDVCVVIGLTDAQKTCEEWAFTALFRVLEGMC